MKVQAILDKIIKKDYTVGIIGLGYVGLPLALRFSECDFKTIGFDTDSEKIQMLQSSKSYIKHIPDQFIKKSLKGKTSFTTDFSLITECDAIIICVPTPLTKHFEPDISYIKNSVKSIMPYLKKNQLICLESTTYPYTTKEEIIVPIQAMGFTAGSDIFFAYSPEREDPGNLNFSTSTIPKIVSGLTQNCNEIACALYSNIINKIIPVSTIEVAEFTKILENIHRAVNIGLVNELKIISDKMNIDIWEAIEAASTKPFGFTAYYPGPGLGGHCIPIDPFYLTWKAREYGVHTKFVELAGQINHDMPGWVVHKTSEALNNFKTCINGANILIIGLAYKKNIDDYRESPALEILKLLTQQKSNCFHYDPYVKNFTYDNSTEVIDLNENILKKMDATIIVTNHDNINYDLILKNSKCIIDTRNAFKEKSSNVFKA